MKHRSGFTIVELLIVIIVIAILATVAFVGYRGITNRAHETALKADLRTTATKIATHKAANTSYPAILSELQLGDTGTAILSYSSDGQTYCLQATSSQLNGTAFHITESGETIAGTCPVTISEATNGPSHSMVRKSDGSVYAWGANSNGTLGVNDTNNRNAPVAITSSGSLSGKKVASLALGADFSLALDSEGSIHSWGINSSGQLGNGTTSRSLRPISIANSGSLAGKKVIDVAAGWTHVVALTEDGALHTWGQLSGGQRGDGSTTSQSLPVEIPRSGVLAGKKISQVQAGYLNTFLLSEDGTLYGIGNRASGSLGDGQLSGLQLYPVSITDSGSLAGKKVKQLSTSSSHSIALADDGSVHGWGLNTSGQVGNGTLTNQSRPVALSEYGALAGKTIISVSAGSTHSAAVGNDGSAVTWGANTNGQLGDGSTTRSTVAIGVLALTANRVTNMSAGSNFTLARTADGQVFSWGLNSSGQLGDGTTAQKNTPIVITIPTP